MICRLPNNKLAIEVETINYGGSETFPTYEYFCDGERLTKDTFETNYWGRIIGLHDIKQHPDLDVVLSQLSKQLKDPL
jgi:hypothetical protein